MFVDSEYYEYKTKATKRSAVDFGDSDIGETTSETNIPKRKPVAVKSRKQKKTPTTAAAGWSLDSDSEDERRPPPKSPLVSSLTRRVADGVLRRTIELKGDVFVELKVYNVKDLEGIAPKDRWERAVVALKYRGESDSPEFNALKKVIKLCKPKFTAEGTFFANKKINK